MIKPTVGRSPAPPAPPKRIRYDAVRDQFLKEAPATDEEALDFFVHLGMYIYGRWQSIAADGEPLDDDNSGRWNDCTDHEFEEIRKQGEQIIDREVARRRIMAFTASVVAKPWGSVLKGFCWIAMRFLEALVTAIALIIWAIFFAQIFPWLIDDAAALLHTKVHAEAQK